MLEPIQLITTKDGKLCVEKTALEILKKYDKQVKVVSIVGNYRTGKSFLLNRLMGRNNGFPLGSTVDSKTKGIWMWLGDHPGDPTKGLVLLDTEGLNDIKKGDKTHDAKIFTLALLLSSIFVYNSKGAIDAQALEGLHVASQLSKHIKTEKNNLSDFAQFFPVFIWALRDFHLELEDMDGNPITEEEYLHNSLAIDSKEGRSQSFAAVKQAIRDYFPKRTCFTFGLPVSMKQLKNLEQKTKSDLDPDFLEAGDRFEKYVYDSKNFLQFQGERMIGTSFATLIEQYVNHLNAGSINIESAHDYMIKTVNEQALRECIASVVGYCKSLSYPMHADDLFSMGMKQRKASFQEFRKRAINLGSNPIYAEKFDVQFDAVAKQFQKQNEDASMTLCTSKLKTLFQGIASKNKEQEFHKPGGFFELKKSIDGMESEYDKLNDTTVLGPSCYKAKEQFWTSQIKPLLQNVMQSDQKLTQAEKKREKIEREKREAEIREKLERQAREDLAARQEEMIQEQRREREAMAADMKASAEEQTRAHELAMENLRLENERMIREQREHEAKIRSEESERRDREMQAMNQRFIEALSAIRQPPEDDGVCTII